MKKAIVILGIILITMLSGGAACSTSGNGEIQTVSSNQEIVRLPAPQMESEVSIEAALLERQSVRAYSDEPLTLAEIAQLLWAAQGVTRPGGYRTAPSAGALYPLEVYLVAGKVTDLPVGVYRYLPDEHALVKTIEGDVRKELSKAAIGQKAVEDAPAVIVMTAIYERTTVKYGDRGIQYVHIEVGSAAENIYLQVVSMDLGTVFIGAFHDEDVRDVLGLGEGEQPLGIMPVGCKP
jgi:SagB-type dehydrogenase family enzyme